MQDKLFPKYVVWPLVILTISCGDWGIRVEMGAGGRGRKAGWGRGETV
jgi:hypothetical protein